MKKIIACCCLLLCAVEIFAEDGIQFSNGTWKEILGRAKKENRLVFIDVYTSWCGPCKKMVSEIFPRKEIGTLFNVSFINYKIDAEKGEGVDVAKNFGVHSYPTYLFVNGDGELVYRTGGYMTSGSFMREANIALKEKEDPKLYIKWKEEYNKGKRDKEFLMEYMRKRALLKMPSADIVEELFPLLTKDELSNKDIISNIIFYDERTEYIPGGRVFDYVIKNYRKLDSLQLVKYPLGIMETGINNYFRKNIISNQREKMLTVMIDAYTQVMQAYGVSIDDIALMGKEVTYKYYSGTHNEAKLNLAVTDFVENGIMKLDIAPMQAKDSVEYLKFMEPYLTGKLDSVNHQGFMMKRIKRNSKMISPSYKLRDAAEAVYEISHDKNMLLKAKEWAMIANEWFPHFSNAAVYAGLLFKNDDQQQAIEMMNLASKDSFLSQAPEIFQLLRNDVEDMKNGKAPVHLWNNR